MTKEKFLEIKSYMEQHKEVMYAMIVIAKIITYLIFVFYPLLIVHLYVKNGINATLIKTILVPGISFAIFSIVRKIINKPRPYEVWKVDPIIEKDTKGKSFPSRHLFSSCLIGMIYVVHVPIVGAAFLIGSAYLAIYRVVMGVHFIRDVVVGSLIGIAIGMIMILI